MIDVEVIRLRQLRNTAMRARAIAMALQGRRVRGSIFERTAHSCWRISRIITGTLRAHPHQSFQRGHGYMRSLSDGVVASMAGLAAGYRGGFAPTWRLLQRVARELDDARALTWSPTLSDTLGRSQKEIRALMNELAAGVFAETGTRLEAPATVAAMTGERRGEIPAANWPYLAF